MIDVTERIKSLTTNYKMTKKENLPAFVDICKQLKYTSSQADSIRSMRMECTKVLNSTVKKNILRDFLTMDGLSILSEWITNCSDHVDETMLKDLISIVSKLNECGGIDVSIIKKSKIGKILSSISKSTNFSKTIKTSVDELIQDWKQKFVKESPTTPVSTAESSSPTIPKKKPTSTPNGEKRKRADDQSLQNENSNGSDSVENVPKKVKSEESLKKKKRVSWSTELEKVKLIEPRQAYVEEVNHRSVQELMNEEKSNERVLMNQQKQMKIMILSNMRNTVNYVTPLRILQSNDKTPPVEVISNEAKIIDEMVRSSPSIIVTESPSSPVIAEISVTNLLNTIGIISNSPTGLNSSTSTRFPPSTSPIPTNPPISNQSPYQQQPPAINYSNNSYPHSHHQPSPYQHQPSPYQRTQPPINNQPYYQNRPSGHLPPQQHVNYHSQHSYQNNSGGQKNKPPPPNQYSNSGNSNKPPPPQPQHKGEPRSFKPIKCLYFVKGQCKNGTKCPFYHEGYDQPVQGIEDYDFEKARFYQALREKKR